MKEQIRLARAFEPRTSADGRRLLVVQKRWPPVARESYDAWIPELAPSSALRQAVHLYRSTTSPEEHWRWYAREYLYEMRHRDESLRAAKRVFEMLDEGQTVTLLCYCKDETHCHRSLLRDLLLGVEVARA